jgi:hypothetical protein
LQRGRGIGSSRDDQATAQLPTFQRRELGARDVVE